MQMTLKDVATLHTSSKIGDRPIAATSDAIVLRNVNTSELKYSVLALPIRKLYAKLVANVPRVGKKIKAALLMILSVLPAKIEQRMIPTRLMKNTSGSNPYIGQTKRRFTTDNMMPFWVPRYVEQTAAKKITMQRRFDKVDK